MKMNISDQKKEDIIDKLQRDIDAANSFYEEEIEPKVQERYKIYNADESYYDEMFPNLSQRSKFVGTDVRDTIGSAMPALMKTFFGSQDVVSVQGMDGSDQDQDKADKMQALIEYELDKNRFYSVAQQWFLDALITNAGIIKVDWQRSYKPKEQTITIDYQAYQQMMAEAQKDKSVKIISVADNPQMQGVDVVYESPVLDKNQPRIMNIMASEFRFSPDATNLQDADFVAHRKIVTLDYLQQCQESGLYSNVDQLYEDSQTPSYTALEQDNNQHIDEETSSDMGRKKVELYECYTNINMTDDVNGKLTPMIITVSNGVILRAEENTYENVPFFILTPWVSPHKIWPVSGFVDVVAQLQHVKTALLRQINYNISQSNDSKMALDPSKIINIQSFLDGQQYLLTNGNVQEAVMQIPSASLQPWTFNFLQYLDDTRENRTGVTRYNQGLDNGALNKTATGIKMITDSANQRLELIARTFAETGFSDLFRFLVKLNQLFVSEDTIVRLANGPMQITPDDLEGRFDLVVNAGTGTSSQQQQLQNLQMCQQIVTQMAQVGLAGPVNAYNLAKRMIETLGFKNADDYIMNPQQAQQIAAQQAAQQPKQDENDSIRSNLDSAPWQIKMQYWQKNGYEVSPDMFVEQVVNQHVGSAIDDMVKGGALDDHRIGEKELRAAAPGGGSSNGSAQDPSAALRSAPSGAVQPTGRSPAGQY